MSAALATTVQWARRGIRGLGIASYLLLVVAGIIGATWPPSGLVGVQHALVVGSGAICAVASATCAASLIWWRWRMEYIAVWWVGAGLVGYVGIALAQRPLTPLIQLFGAITLALSMTILARGLSLVVFDSQTRQALEA